MDRLPRQAPISCQLCRSMKLKCNREQPCSNCTSRGITCEPAIRGGQMSRKEIEQRRRRRSPSTSANEEILNRLKILEELVLRGQNSGGSAYSQAEPALRSSYSTPSYISEGDGDSMWLEGVGTREVSLLSGLSNGFSFHVIPIQVVLTTEPALTTFPGNNVPMGDPPKTVWLPLKAEALWLFDKYIEHVAYLHHVLHMPTVRLLINNLYDNLHQGVHVEPSHVGLVLSIFASTAYMLNSCNGSDILFANLQNAIKCAFKWSKSALDVLEHSKRTTSGSIEHIQAAIILSFVVFNLEGFTTSFRTLSSSALIMARELCLHRIDANIPTTTARVDHSAALEVKRRIWWHLVSTDWLLSLTGGPQEGTYSIHPKHMQVCYPSNVNDMDLDNYGPGSSVPLTEPTSMTYFLLRIHLAEICRSVVDALPPPFADRVGIDYENIIALNRKFDQFLDELPFFFRLDEASRRQSSEIDKRYPEISVQRYIICSTVHSRRFKLNQQFLIRTSLDSRYQYSRDVCLKSARTVIEVKRLLERDTSPFASTHVRMATIIHTLFLATAVLVMDLCFNKTEGLEDQRRTEVVEACRMLQEAEEASVMGYKFLKSLMDILIKYRIKLPDSNEAIDSRRKYPNLDADLLSGDSSFAPGSEKMAYILESTNEFNNLDELWQDFMNTELMQGPKDWDYLYSALDERVS